MTELWAISLVLFACFISSGGPILMKLGIRRGGGLLNWIFNPHVIAGASMYGISQALFIPALRGGDLSVLYPLVASTYVWVTLWSVLILKEKFDILRFAGISTVIVGIIMVSLG